MRTLTYQIQHNPQDRFSDIFLSNMDNLTMKQVSARVYLDINDQILETVNQQLFYNIWFNVRREFLNQVVKA